ncbi:hypothetical protein D3C87_1036060 [compost metagenome]
MKLVLLAIGMVFSVVSTNAMASGCDPYDGGSEVISKMDVIVSGQLVCVAGELCVLEVSGSSLKLYGTELSSVNGTERVSSTAGTIVFEKTWGSCTGYDEAVVFSVEINGQKFSGKLSSYSGY